ncbi:hypothetical protein CVT24_001228 [Panaeolus cyanescens]|uniref:Uncharacterized protein n=1 Tax=Panaeolus cyanescens TaxID=181874 RepID=A0A409YZ69_9AGAR|nr:hypothetical protein CVT24_001228 [Panaeolus cyanescens]
MTFRPQTPHISDPHLTITSSLISIKAPARLSDLKIVVKDVFAYFHSPRAYTSDAPKAVVISAQTDHFSEYRTHTDNDAVFEEFSFLMDTLSSRIQALHSFELNIVNYHDGCICDPAFAAFVHRLPSLTRRQDLGELKINAKTVQSNVELFGAMCRDVMGQIEANVSRPITEQVNIALTITGGAGDAFPYVTAKQLYMVKAREVESKLIPEHLLPDMPSKKAEHLLLPHPNNDKIMYNDTFTNESVDLDVLVTSEYVQNGSGKDQREWVQCAWCSFKAMLPPNRGLGAYKRHRSANKCSDTDSKRDMAEERQTVREAKAAVQSLFVESVPTYNNPISLPRQYTFIHVHPEHGQSSSTLDPVALAHSTATPSIPEGGYPLREPTRSRCDDDKEGLCRD